MKDRKTKSAAVGGRKAVTAARIPNPMHSPSIARLCMAAIVPTPRSADATLLPRPQRRRLQNQDGAIAGFTVPHSGHRPGVARTS